MNKWEKVVYDKLVGFLDAYAPSDNAKDPTVHGMTRAEAYVMVKFFEQHTDKSEFTKEKK
jgi:hypothetical protein